MLNFTLALVAGASVSVVPAAPPPEQAASGPEIVVRGARDRDRQISQFISDLTPAPSHGQLARFEDKLCPRAYGMPASYDELVTGRMRAVAAAAGIPLGKVDCRPNAVVIVTRDKRSFIKRLAQQRPYMVPDEWSGWTLRDVARDPSPAAAWSIEDERASDSAGFYPAKEQRINWKAGGESRLRANSRPVFVASVLVIQADALEGFSTRQLADYAAMRAFVHVDPKRIDRKSNTILTLLDTPMGEPAPLTLTEWDLSFLKAYYSGTLNRFAEYDRAQMTSAMKRDLDQKAELPRR